MAQPDQLPDDRITNEASGSRQDMLIEASAAHPLRTGHVDDGERFTQLLGAAVNATIIGFTNENLTAGRSRDWPSGCTGTRRR